MHMRSTSVKLPLRYERPTVTHVTNGPCSLTNMGEGGIGPVSVSPNGGRPSAVLGYSDQ